ncbi:uncharacterized protein LTR77_002233 [Saxophila tyrrhenica]|uniref:Uncharacterized protein n=1 Tax=Saxophila tyrrhenica TaxID=1690608 RepID=A0AAV9PIC7_9PEZI|nr:hypothetical protein LTR77_002233 [Saxophila tyrrhenica]
MFTTARSVISTLAFSILLLPATARVLWIPEEFDPLEADYHLQPRDVGKCGGDSSLTYCGGGYTCLALQTGVSVTAAMCCPEGGNCAQINPISCDTSLQNTTITQLHADPPQKLKSCGTACCPMGYDCKNGQCVAKTTPKPPAGAPKPTSPTTSSTATGSSPSSSTTSATSSSTTSPSPSKTAAGAGAGAAAADQSSPSPSSSSGSDFNGKSFAAGFVPGIAIGAFIAALILMLLFRRKRGESDSYIDEKGRGRDTLTDLGPLEYRRPTMHGRSISEPHADPSAGHRTDFLRSTPPRAVGNVGAMQNGYVVDVHSPASASPPKVRALFSHSPFMPQYPSTPPSVHPPVPAHLKRGTLSFKISPIRVLKKQKSMHSLRRQMTDASAGTSNSRNDGRHRRPRPEHSRSASTETIQVLMPSNEPYTPERPLEMPEHIQTLASTTYQPPSSSSGSNSTWNSRTRESPVDRQAPYASSSRYPSEVQPTPTRPPVPRMPTGMAGLGSPYTPTNHKGSLGGGLGVKRESLRRQTTFSEMMEKAGLRRSDLMMGGR